MKQFKGKAIYNPSGKAGEYSQWACNLFTGCSNDCDYCYCKKGVLSSVWSNKAQLKKCFKNETHALEIFEKELKLNLAELQQYGLFFTFTSDPMLPETRDLTRKAIEICIDNFVRVKILTRRADFFDMLEGKWTALHWSISTVLKAYIAFGFTLTGHDELEPGASPNSDRIEAMRTLHDAGFKTWASIEPIVDLESSLSMINKTIGFCDLYKIGLMSGKKYDWRELRGFMLACTPLESKFYFKDSFVSQADLDRANPPKNCVGRGFDLFNAR